MAPVVEYTLSNPILRDTREAHPDVQLRFEDERIAADGSPEMVFVATGEPAAVEAFEERLPTDPTVESYQLRATFEEGKLLQITLSDDGFRGMTYPIAANLGITFLAVEVRGTTVRYRAQIPTLEELSQYREHCADRGLDFQLVTLSDSASLEQRDYGLTARQREVLQHALEAGYFEVPRQTSLAELAGELEVSDQALSALLRRGERRLLRHTIGTDT